MAETEAPTADEERARGSLVPGGALPLLLIAWMGGCGGTSSDDGGSDEGTAASSEASSGSATEATSEASGTEDSRGSESDGSTDMMTGDLPPAACDPLADECPADEKCSYGRDDPEASCRPIRGDDPLGAPCEADADGDSCELGAICIDVDATTGVGWCAAPCAAPDDAETCATLGLDATCLLVGSPPAAACRPYCDPLDGGSNSCPEGGESCGLISEPGFACVGPSTGDAAVGEPCTFSSDCAAPALCFSGAVVGPEVCGQHASCCAPVCDLADPQCPIAGTSCSSIFGDAAPERWADTGVCLSSP